jgi:hypothetical protein
MTFTNHSPLRYTTVAGYLSDTRYRPYTSCGQSTEYPYDKRSNISGIFGLNSWSCDLVAMKFVSFTCLQKEIKMSGNN